MAIKLKYKEKANVRKSSSKKSKITNTKKNKFYITTAIDYPSAEPHIGHAYQKIIADILARWNKLQGKEVFFLTGTDEHGQKISKLAREKGVSEQKFVDEMSSKFKEAWTALNIQPNRFIRTTDQDHVEKSQEFIKLMNKAGDIYKGKYSGLYCVDCEAYYTEKDLVEGKCPFHPNKTITEFSEDAYFFKLSRYQNKLLELYEKNPDYILPRFRRPEIIARVKEGLKDLNITRTNFKWGVPFPLDKDHVTYVWYEALLNYLTGIDWPNETYKKFWPADVEILGIDNGWFHCVIWPAMLMSVGIKPAKTILINGFLTFNGQKISKSLGNAISPITLVEKYGADSIRYFVARNFVFGQDGDFSEQVLIERHNNELANKLGNLVSRLSTLAEQNGLKKCENKLIRKFKIKEVEKHMENYEFDKALNLIFEFIDNCNEYIQEKKPWESKDQTVLYELVESIRETAKYLSPFIPETSEKINEIFKTNEIKKAGILFKKIEEKDVFKKVEKEIVKDVKKIEKKIEGVFKKDIKKKEKIIKQEIPGIVDMNNVKFDDWAKLDLRVGKILSADDIEGADKLFKLTIDIGKEKRVVCAGLKQYYTKEQLKNKLCILFVNLEPRTMKGIESKGMILAAVSDDHKKVFLIAPDKDIEPGSKVS